MDRHDLYELCVQSPRHTAKLLRAIHGKAPASLGEDFSGGAALSREWVRSIPGGRAVAVDHDPDVLGRATGAAGVAAHCADVLDVADAVDVLFVGNFSIGEWHSRPALVRYLSHARSRLNPGGVFVCDTYGGESAFLIGDVERTHPAPDGGRINYTWEQRSANPLTGRVVNALHFTVERAGETVAGFRDAFVYDWRLWSIAELRDAMHEAGFRSTAVYAPSPDAEDDAGEVYANPIENPSELDDSYIVCVAARV